MNDKLNSLICQVMEIEPDVTFNYSDTFMDLILVTWKLVKRNLDLPKFPDDTISKNSKDNYECNDQKSSYKTSAYNVGAESDEGSSKGETKK